MGRPTKLTEKLQDEICKLIATGVPHLEAALEVGICETTFYNWRNRGEASKRGKYVEFLKATKEAEARFVASRVLRIYTAADESPVETKTVEKEIKAPDGTVIGSEVTTTTIEKPPDWRAALELLQRRRPQEFGRTQRIEHSGEIDGPPAAAVVTPIMVVFDDGASEADQEDDQADAADETT
ncbi:MAG: hypothetical protein F4Y26_00555 [Gammaproteobacteria bacterium]|nr:hypothetical protein [Gammaproteobacteria bacterium]